MNSLEPLIIKHFDYRYDVTKQRGRPFEMASL